MSRQFRQRQRQQTGQQPTTSVNRDLAVRESALLNSQIALSMHQITHSLYQVSPNDWATTITNLIQAQRDAMDQLEQDVQNVIQQPRQREAATGS